MTGRAILFSGALSGLAATLVSAVFITAFFVLPNGGAHGLTGFLSAILLMSTLTLVPAGIFGFVAGLFGGIWWSYRGRHIRTVAQLLAESAGLGLLLSLPFPVFHKAIGWGINSESWFDVKAVLFSIAVGCTCAALVALALRLRLVTTLPTTQ